MKKQGDGFMKVVMLLLAAAVLVYFGYAAYRYISAPLSTVTALEYEADVSTKVTGYIVRDEEQLTSTASITVPFVSEGKRISAGQTLAVTYQTVDDQQHQEEVTEVQNRVKQLSYAVAENISLSTLDQDIDVLLNTVAIRNTLRQTDVGDELNAKLKGFVIRSGTDHGDVHVLKDDLAELQNQLTEMTSQSGNGTEELRTAVPGYFSGTADGYEAVLTPEALETMTVAEYKKLDNAKETVPDDVYGKLIKSNVWYFLASVDVNQLDETREGDTLYLSFSGSAGTVIQMRVERISEVVDDTCLLVLSSRSYIQDVTLLREQTCVLTFHTYAGIRIPKEAIHVNEAGQSGVYVLEGAVARWKNVEIVYAGADNYVAELNTSSTNNLWPGDEIILGSNLYDGKVVY